MRVAPAGVPAGGSSCGPLGNDCSDAACTGPTYECLATSGLNVCQLKNRYVSGVLCSGNDCPAEHPTCLLYKAESGGICVTSAELACACASKNKSAYLNCTQ